MTTKQDFSTQLTAFYKQGSKLLEAWYEVESDGVEVPVEGFPFAESFDEVLARIAAWSGDHVRPWAAE